MKKKKIILGLILLICIILLIALNISTSKIIEETKNVEEKEDIKYNSNTVIKDNENKIKEEGEIVFDKDAVLLY